MDKTAKKRQYSLRERRLKAGWRRKEFWIPPGEKDLNELHEAILKLAKSLPEKPDCSFETAYAVLRAQVWELVPDTQDEEIQLSKNEEFE